MFDPSIVKLGKLPARHDPRTLRMGKYLPGVLPTPPPYAIDGIGATTKWGMMLNDSLGDCTIAACAHAIQVWTRPWGMVTPSDSVVLDAYQRWDGYDPKIPSSDLGGNPLIVLNRWRTEGLGGHKILSYVAPQPQNMDHIKWAIAIFGGVYIGLWLPLTAQKQDIWDVTDPKDKGNWGGHAVFVPTFDKDGLTCITWGTPQRMTWNFWNTYCDESYAILSGDWTPNEFDMPTMLADLALVTG